MIPVLITVAAGLLITGVVVATQRAQAERVEAMRAAATRLGWGFREDVDFRTIPDLDRFELFRQGHSRKLRNVMTSPAGDPRGVLFEYSYTISTGKTQTTRRQTVIYVTSDALDVPSFSLRPQSFLHAIAAAFGYQDINVDGRPTFSEMFLLRGEDEGRVRAAFTEPVAMFFERRARVCAAGMGREVLFWRPGRIAKGEEIDTLIAEGFELVSRFVG